MSLLDRPDVESLPGDLDRFLGNFFSRRGWRSEIKVDPAGDRLYLDVRLADARLSCDDRFFWLVEHFGRAQDSLLRRRVGLPLCCRVYAADGSDLSDTLHACGASRLDDDARGSSMQRRLLLLSLRHRAFAHLLLRMLLWSATFTLLLTVTGLPVDAVFGLAMGALLLQALLVRLAGEPRP